MASGGRTSWRPMVALVGCLGLLAGLLAGCRQQRTPILTPATALQVLETDRLLNDRANATLDLGLQDEHETGAAAQIDDASFRQLRQAGKSAIPDPFQVSQPQVFVPVQYRYPAEFVGEWTETAAGSHGRSLSLFVKSSPADRWRATLFIGQPADSPDVLPDLAVDEQGYGRRLSPTEFDHLSTGPDQLAGDLSSLWNRFLDPSATVPPDLAAGNWTTARNERIRQDVAQKAAQHLNEAWMVSPGPFHYRSAYRTRSGDALVFLSVIEHSELFALAPLQFNTPLSYRGRQVLPVTVTNGAHVLSLDVLYTVAALVGPGGRPARVIAGYSGPVAADRIG